MSVCSTSVLLVVQIHMPLECHCLCLGLCRCSCLFDHLSSQIPAPADRGNEQELDGIEKVIRSSAAHFLCVPPVTDLARHGDDGADRKYGSAVVLAHNASICYGLRVHT